MQAHRRLKLSIKQRPSPMDSAVDFNVLHADLSHSVPTFVGKLTSHFFFICVCNGWGQLTRANSLIGILQCGYKIITSFKLTMIDILTRRNWEIAPVVFVLFCFVREPT